MTSVNETISGASNSGCVYDAQAKLWMKDRQLVSNLCNATVYGGRNVITPDMIEQCPVEQNAVIAREAGKFATDNRFRDLAFHVRPNGRHGFLLCLEIQCKQDYGMPLRIHDYNNRELLRLSSEPDCKSNRKLPLIVTLVLNFSDSRWKGPCSFLDMARYRDACIDKVAEQGRFILVDPYNMSRKIFYNLCTDLKVVLSCFPVSKDESRFDSWLNEYENAQLSTETLRFLEVYFDVKRKDSGNGLEGGMKDMCEAIRIKCERHYNEGRAEGISKGRAEGISKGRAEGISKGRTESLIKVATNALRLKMSVKDIRAITGLPYGKIASIAKSIEPTNA